MHRIISKASIALTAAGALSAGLVALSTAPSGASTASRAAVTAHRASVSNPPVCTAREVRVGISTDQTFYLPGEPVTITETIRNVSHKACTLGIGPADGQAPGVYILDEAGNQVWYNCDVNDMPGACLFYWQLTTFEPGQRWSRTYTWDQGTSPDGGPVVQVPDGVYNVTTWWATVSTSTGAPVEATTEFAVI
jgi:hypothetical protein